MHVKQVMEGATTLIDILLSDRNLRAYLDTYYEDDLDSLTDFTNKVLPIFERFSNHYLLYDGAIEAKEGALAIGGFLGYWFIRKALWASVSEIKGNAASLKKFYTFMLEKGDIKIDVLYDLKEMIKEEMPEWLATLERYDDPNITSSEEIWGL